MPIIIQGHRGARGLLPENTIESCIEAIKWGVDGLEIDVVASKDGQIVVSHDPWMSPIFCSFPDGKPVDTEGVSLKKLDYTDIRTFDCGRRGHPLFKNQKPINAYKPTLYELIKAIEAYCSETNTSLPFWNIEVKSAPAWYYKYVPPPREFIELLKHPLSILPEKSFYISSFDPHFLRAMKREMPRVSLAFLTENRLNIEQNLRVLRFKPQIYSPYYRFITPKMVAYAHRKGIKIMTWTVNELKSIGQLQQMGVDGIITDYPNLLGK